MQLVPLDNWQSSFIIDTWPAFSTVAEWEWEREGGERFIPTKKENNLPVLWGNERSVLFRHSVSAHWQQAWSPLVVLPWQLLQTGEWPGKFSRMHFELCSRCHLASSEISCPSKVGTVSTPCPLLQHPSVSDGNQDIVRVECTLWKRGNCSFHTYTWLFQWGQK